MSVKRQCRQNTSKWHDWFAWYPVTFDTKVQGDRVCWTRAFWTTIQRRRKYYYAGDEWEYRLYSHRED